ncbi:flagellar assembly protein FliH [Bordetella sp. FB-8]|uniref:flagellar assembly protein FliH n=1 Tax=Bordetella sp. FB-8 TaxID=1159870 RepID=UPI0003796480|nr:flagellar assembly protein FliH [Bordetella sp. FB-8]
MSDRPSVDAHHLVPRGADWRRWEMVSFDEPEVEVEPDVPVEPEPAGPSLEEIIQTARDEAYREAYQLGQADGHKQGYMQGLHEGRQAGHAEGHSSGHAEGLVRGREQGQQEAAHLHALVGRVAQAMSDMEEQMGQSLITLALDIAAQVLRGELAEHPESMLHAVREVLHLNPAAPQGVMRLWVHPEDIELVRLHLADELKDANWRVLADESIERGGCRAESPYGDIDATLSTRWRRVAASLGRNANWDPQHP